MWELELIPVYVLLSLWGGKKRLYAGTKFILYTALGSIFILLAALAMAFYGSPMTFNMVELAQKNYPISLEILAYFGFLIAYGVKLSAFPVHTWLPDTHGEAHYSTCMLLAGILLKMGGYALIRVNMDLLPNAHYIFAPFLVVIGVVNIIYAALTSFAQRNLKRKIAYSSVSHMGFVLIGLGSLTDSGLSGAMLQMVSHGLIGASLFFLAGATYDRTRTLLLEDLGGLAVQMPKVFAMFSAVSLASLALPGMSGFISELMIFLGFVTSQSYSFAFRALITLFEAIGIILTPIYLLSMLRQVFYGSKRGQIGHSRKLVDAGPREIFVVFCLMIPMIGIGVYPKMLTQIYESRTDLIVTHYQQEGMLTSNRATIWKNWT
jgi:NAD(P)H-quinone oxidoreductase subunit 4